MAELETTQVKAIGDFPPTDSEPVTQATGQAESSARAGETVRLLALEVRAASVGDSGSGYWSSGRVMETVGSPSLSLAARLLSEIIIIMIIESRLAETTGTQAIGESPPAEPVIIESIQEQPCLSLSARLLLETIMICRLAPEDHSGYWQVPGRGPVEPET